MSKVEEILDAIWVRSERMKNYGKWELSNKLERFLLMWDIRDCWGVSSETANQFLEDLRRVKDECSDLGAQDDVLEKMGRLISTLEQSLIWEDRL